MRITRGLTTIAFLVSVFALVKYTPHIANPVSDQDGLQPVLTEVALKSLRAEYAILITGVKPTGKLVRQAVGMTHSTRESEERIETALRLQRGASEDGRSYSNIEVKLIPVGIEHRAGKVILHAVEETTEHFSIENPQKNQPVITESKINHDFVFLITRPSRSTENDIFTVRFGDLEYTLETDITGPEMFSRSDYSRLCCNP